MPGPSTVNVKIETEGEVYSSAEMNEATITQLTTEKKELLQVIKNHEKRIRYLKDKMEYMKQRHLSEVEDLKEELRGQKRRHEKRMEEMLRDQESLKERWRSRRENEHHLLELRYRHYRRC